MKRIIYILCLLTMSVGSVNTSLFAVADPVRVAERDIFDEEAGEKFNGCFSGMTSLGKDIELFLKEDGEIYTGKLFYNGQKYPVEAELDGASLSGVAGTTADHFSFTFRRSAGGYLFKTGDDTVRMQETAFPDLKEKWEGAKVTLQADSKSGNRYSGRLVMRGERMSFSGTVKGGVLEGEISLSDGKKRAFTLEPEGKNLLFKAGSFADELEKTFSITLANGVTMEMVWIEPGSFMMGSPTSELGRDDDETQHRVTLTQGYWMGKYEVTQAQYEAVMGENPSYFKGVDLPVERLSWEDAMSFCKKLTEQERAAGRLPAGYEYTLPTEAQWEYACRAGTTTIYNGSSLNELGWYDDNSSGKTHPVGQKQPNAWGLYDMHGNVWEWCLDWHGSYPSSAVTDPKGANTGSSRVSRGGSWYSYAVNCRSASRFYSTPGSRLNYFGFRVCLSYSSHP